MTGSSSWRHLTDAHSTERSDAWSELLALPSHPRSSLGHSSLAGVFGKPYLVSSRATNGSALSDMHCGITAPLGANHAGRQKSGSFIADPVNATTLQGLRSLDPLFSTMDYSATGTTPQGTYAKRPITTRRSLPRENAFKPLSSLQPSASHPQLHQECLERGSLSPVCSHSAMSLEAMGLAGECLSPVPSEAIIQQEEYRQAALDFVLELAGPHVPS